MTGQRVSISFLTLYERDGGAINELCRTCLCKTDDEYISIKTTMPWSQRESCTAQKMLEQILNKEVESIVYYLHLLTIELKYLCKFQLNKVQPQPQRICSKCIMKIKAIALFRNQCIESDNILTEFHNHIENQPPDIESKYLQHDFMFDMDEMMFTEQMDDKFLPVFDTEILKLESNVLDEIKRDLNPEPEEPIPAPPPPPSPLPPPPPLIPPPLIPPPSPPKTIINVIKTSDKEISKVEKAKVEKAKVEKVKVRKATNTNKKSPVTKKKSKKGNNLNDVDTYVHQLLKEDIKASLKSLEKKYKKEKPEKNFTGLCEQCGLTFSSSNEYKKHIRTHEDKGE